MKKIACGNLALFHISCDKSLGEQKKDYQISIKAFSDSNVTLNLHKKVCHKRELFSSSLQTTEATDLREAKLNEKIWFALFFVLGKKVAKSFIANK